MRTLIIAFGLLTTNVFFAQEVQQKPNDSLTKKEKIKQLSEVSI